MDTDCFELEGFLPVGVIGYGSTSSVHLAERCIDAKLVSIKKIRDGNLNVNREIENLRRCKHPNICQLLDVIHKNGWVYIVMEYARGGCLSKWLMNGPTNSGFMHRVFIQLISALEYLHKECRMIHRDVKLENIMLDEMNVKLIDFGFSKALEEDAHKGTACGSPAYVAPEIIKREEYGFPADVWAAGVVLYIMAVGRLPFSDPSVPGLLKKIVTEDLTFPENMRLDNDLTNLLVRMFDKNPATRITIQEIKDSDWMIRLKDHALISSAQSLSTLKFEKTRSQTTAPPALVPRALGVGRKRKMTNPLIVAPLQPVVRDGSFGITKTNTFKASQIRPMMIPYNILSEKRKSLVVPVPVPI